MSNKPMPRKTQPTPYTGGCLCGAIRYTLSGKPTFPHFCTCHQCQRWSGAPVVAWVDFPICSLAWDGPSGEPAWYRSSARTQRGFCSTCGGTVCALDDGSDTVCMTVSTLDEPDAIVPKSQSFRESAPSWLRVSAESPKQSTSRRVGTRGRRAARG